MTDSLTHWLTDSLNNIGSRDASASKNGNLLRIFCYVTTYLIFAYSITSSACKEKFCHVENNLHWMQKLYNLMEKSNISVKIVYFNKTFTHWKNLKFVVLYGYFVWRKILPKIWLAEKFDKYRVCVRGHQTICGHQRFDHLWPWRNSIA